MKYAFVRNDFFPETQASLHISDLALQRSYAVFDFFRMAGNQPLFLNDHLDRFYASAAALRLQVGYDRKELTQLITDLTAKNNLPGTGIKLLLTGGYSEDGVTPGEPNLIISQHTINPPRPEQLKKGIALTTYEYQRQLPSVKTTDYLMAVWLTPYIDRRKADELLYHQDGFISESPRSNFFAVMDDETIVTPAENILHGITRKQLLQVAPAAFRVQERPLHLDELKKAREVFITSTSKQILPVSRVDDHHFSERRVTDKLSQLLLQEIR